LDKINLKNSPKVLSKILLLQIDINIKEVMDLKKILSVSGKSGLFEVVGQLKNGAIVESLIDKKRFPLFASEKMSSLEDISVFCENEDMPLLEVLKKIFEKENAGQTSVKTNAHNDDLKKYFESVLPEYDKERVYVSDIKKILNWYNLLLENELLVFEDEKQEEASQDKNEETVEPAETTEAIKAPEKTKKTTKKKIKE